MKSLLQIIKEYTKFDDSNCPDGGIYDIEECMEDDAEYNDCINAVYKCADDYYPESDEDIDYNACPDCNCQGVIDSDGDCITCPKCGQVISRLV